MKHNYKSMNLFRRQTLMFLSYQALFLIMTIASTSVYAQTPFGSCLTGDNNYDIYGHAVSMSLNGEIMAVGIPWYDNGGGETDDYGAVKVYKWDGSDWNQLGTTIVGAVGGDKAGWGISLSGDGSTIAVGSYAHQVGEFPGAGHARMYKWNGTMWNQLGNAIEGQSNFSYDGFSLSLSCDGTKLALGAYKHEYPGYKGKTRMFSYNGTSWSQMGADIIGEAEGDFSGWKVAISGTGHRVAISAKTNNGGGAHRGHVRIYDWAGGTWTQVGSDIDGESDNDYSGHAMHMSADGNTIAIGAYNNAGNGGQGRGHVRIYRWISSSWSKLGGDLDGESDWDYFGTSVALSANGNVVAIGAINNDGQGTDNGEVKIFTYSGSTWTQTGYDINGTNTADHFGFSVALSRDGSKVMVGARDHDAGGTDKGKVCVYRLNNSDSLATCDNSALPVSLLSFKGISIKNNVLLNWVTTSEINNDRFEIERSLNGTNFINIGTVEGNGNSNKVLNYNFVDQNAFVTSNVLLYYRLKQIDFNGDFEYTPLAVVHIDKVKGDKSDIDPNPFTDNLNIKISGTKGENVNMYLTNLQGQRILQVNNTLSSEGLIRINTLDIPSGIYYLTIEFGKQLMHHKVVKH